jgi:hypothetical protein
MNLYTRPILGGAISQCFLKLSQPGPVASEYTIREFLRANQPASEACDGYQLAHLLQVGQTEGSFHYRNDGDQPPLMRNEPIACTRQTQTIAE